MTTLAEELGLEADWIHQMQDEFRETAKEVLRVLDEWYGEHKKRQKRLARLHKAQAAQHPKRHKHPPVLAVPLHKRGY